MNERCHILSYSSGFGERIFGIPYFQYNNSNEAVAILTCFCLGISYGKRVLFLQKQTAIYFDFINDKTRGYVINDLPDRFNKLIKPLLLFFGFYTVKNTAVPMKELNQKSGIVSQDLIDAFNFKQKGITNYEKFKDDIFHVTCWWPIIIQNQKCCICGCKQPGFMLHPKFYCFDCIIEFEKLENVREVWENTSLTDAEGNIIKMFTRYITPTREIVFFDRDGSRMIYLSKGRVELPLCTETLYQLTR